MHPGPKGGQVVTSGEFSVPGTDTEGAVNTD